MKLQTKVREVEVILVTAAIGPLAIGTKNGDVEVGVGEYLVVDQEQGVYKLSAAEVRKRFVSEGENLKPLKELKVGTARPKRTHRKKPTGLGANPLEAKAAPPKLPPDSFEASGPAAGKEG